MPSPKVGVNIFCLGVLQWLVFAFSNISEHFPSQSCLFIYHHRAETCGCRQAGDCFSFYRPWMDISIMILFVIHDSTALYEARMVSFF